VIVAPETQAALQAAQAAGRSTWRVSSTVFAHCASDQLLQPLAAFAQRPGAAERYPPRLAGEQVRQELEAIQLGKRAAAVAGAGAGRPAAGEQGSSQQRGAAAMQSLSAAVIAM